jgi:hypothetical protein
MVFDRCQTPGCKCSLLSVLEGIRGTCTTCWFESQPPRIRRSMNALMAAAFDEDGTKAKAAALDTLERMRATKR